MEEERAGDDDDWRTWTASGGSHGDAPDAAAPSRHATPSRGARGGRKRSRPVESRAPAAADFVAQSKFSARTEADKQAAKRRLYRLPYSGDDAAVQQDLEHIARLPRKYLKYPEGVPGYLHSQQAKPAPGLSTFAQKWCEDAIRAEAVSDPLPKHFVPRHILDAHLSYQDNPSCRAVLWSADLLRLGDWGELFRPVQEDGRWTAYDVAEATSEVSLAPSRVLAEVAALLVRDEPLPLSLLMRVQGVITTCAHYAVTFSQTLGRDCFLPGFLYDPRWVRADRNPPTHRLFPHALNMTDIVNDLSDAQQQSWSPTPWHGWCKDVLEHGRVGRVETYPRASRRVVFSLAKSCQPQRYGGDPLPQLRISVREVRQGALVPPRRRGRGLGAGLLYESRVRRGAAERLVGVGPDHRRDVPPTRDPIRPTRKGGEVHALPTHAPRGKRATRRERDWRFQPYSGAPTRPAPRRVEPDLRDDEEMPPAGDEPAEAEPALTEPGAAVGASRVSLMPAAPKTRAPAPPPVPTSGAVDAETAMSAPARPAAQAAGSIPAAAPGAVGPPQPAVSAASAVTAAAGGPAGGGPPVSHDGDSQLPDLGAIAASAAVPPEFWNALREFMRVHQGGARRREGQPCSRECPASPPPRGYHPACHLSKRRQLTSC